MNHLIDVMKVIISAPVYVLKKIASIYALRRLDIA
jgi:hypothetical protein